MGSKPRERLIENKVLPLGLLTPHKKNYNRHPEAQLVDLRASLKEFGQVRSIVVQKDKRGKGYTVIAGHGIVQAAQGEGLTTLKADVIPSSWSETKALAYLAADNNLGKFSDPDQDQLAAIVQEVMNAEGAALARLAAGEQSALDALLVRANPNAETADVGELVDRAGELQKKWRVNRGDVWEIDRVGGNSPHRLMCGDSTSAADVGKLMGGELCDLIVIDPPYGVSYADKNKFLNAIAKGNRIQKPIKGDDGDINKIAETLWRPAFENLYNVAKAGCVVYSFAPQGGDQMMMMMMMQASFPVRHELIWLKNNHVLGRVDYAYKHEPILYAWKKGGHRYFGGFQTSVIECNKPNASKLHPTMKPVELVEKLIQNSSLVGEIVLDVFAGSSTTLVACEQSGRVGRGMELAEDYIACSLERLSLLGLTPRRIESGSEAGTRRHGKTQGKAAAKRAAN